VAFRAQPLAEALDAHHATLAPAATAGVALVDGAPDDVRAALAEAVVDPANIAVSMMAVPAQTP
jgi:hypothetical protein